MSEGLYQSSFKSNVIFQPTFSSVIGWCIGHTLFFSLLLPLLLDTVSVTRYFSAYFFLCYCMLYQSYVIFQPTSSSVIGYCISHTLFFSLILPLLLEASEADDTQHLTQRENRRSEKNGAIDKRRPTYESIRKRTYYGYGRLPFPHQNYLLTRPATYTCGFHGYYPIYGNSYQPYRRSIDQSLKEYEPHA
jgi:hypothetical protein